MLQELNTTSNENKRKLLKSLILKQLKGSKSHDSEDKNNKSTSNGHVVENNLYQRIEVQEIIQTKVSAILKVPQSDIKMEQDLAEYGFDSMGMMALCREINSAFSSDTKEVEIDAGEMISLRSVEDMTHFVFEFLKDSNIKKNISENDLGHTAPVQSSSSNSDKKHDDVPVTFASFGNITSREDLEVTAFNDYLNDNNYKNVPRKSSAGPIVHLAEGDTELINFTNFDYLGYGSHPNVKEAAKTSIDIYGGGASASPVVGGQLVIHNELENELVSFFGIEDSQVALFPSGYNAVFGTISAYMNEGDHVVMDAYCHASIVDGAVFSKATLHYFVHNNLDDLNNVLKRIDNGVNRILVCTEGVFSTDGDTGDIKGVVEVSKKYGAKVLVDEAHSVLLTGENGKGVCSSQGVLEEVDFLIATLSKSFPGMGGFLLASKSKTQYVGLYARNRLFSTALPASIIGGSIAALKLAASNDGDQRREKLLNNGKILRSLYEGKLKLAKSETWIVSVIIGDEDTLFKIADYLKERGVLVSALCFPVVPRGFARLRHFLSSEHTKEQLERTVELAVEAAEKFGVNINKNAEVSTEAIY